MRPSGLVATDVIVVVPPITTLAGSDEHEITGGCASFTVNLAVQEATSFWLPSLKLAVTWYAPACKPVVSRRMESPVSLGLTPEPLQVYATLRLGLRFVPLAVAVTGSPAKTSPGRIEQAALGGVTERLPPHINTSPAWSRAPVRSVLGVEAGGP